MSKQARLAASRESDGLRVNKTRESRCPSIYIILLFSAPTGGERQEQKNKQTKAEKTANPQTKKTHQSIKRARSGDTTCG
jgi:hypothetical protein